MRVWKNTGHGVDWTLRYGEKGVLTLRNTGRRTGFWPRKKTASHSRIRTKWPRYRTRQSQMEISTKTSQEGMEMKENFPEVGWDWGTLRFFRSSVNSWRLLCTPRAFFPRTWKIREFRHSSAHPISFNQYNEWRMKKTNFLQKKRFLIIIFVPGSKTDDSIQRPVCVIVIAVPTH